MKEYKPSFFDKFYCIADKCDFTCCRDWSIGVDEETYEEWKRLNIPCRCNLAKGKLSDYVEEDALVLNDKLKCHFLNEKGLCNIVLEYGEEALSQTCHTFPKVIYDYTNRSEYTLNLGCKFAVEKLLEEKDFIINESVCEEDVDYEPEDRFNIPEWVFSLRDYMLKFTYQDIDNIELLKSLLLKSINLNNLYKSGQKVEALIDEFIGRPIGEKIVGKSDYLAMDDKKIDSYIERVNLLIDMLSEYKIEGMYKEFIDSIFDKANNELLVSDKELLDKVNLFNKDFNGEINNKIRRIIQNEIYGFIIPSQEDESLILEAITRKIEWLIMEIVTLEQWLFFIWEDKNNISDDEFVTATAVLFRITGFSDEDIDEYLNDEYISDIWDDAYIDLICN
ncbi:MAG: flagellin lysine-N-methylase [Lachnospiraceae bacterium]|nr:flagellin lysine-N-methylase [Lachnospiraceae bacterium]